MTKDKTSSRPRFYRLRLLLSFVLLAVGALVVATWATTDRFASFGRAPAGARLERVRSAPQYDAEAQKFANSIATRQVQPENQLPLLRETFFGDQVRTPQTPLPIISEVAAALATPPETGLRVTWLGHSTLLIEIDGFTLLTDPIWSRYASPSTIIGPTRFHAPPLPLDELSETIDAVLLSHDHYDHLDYPTILALADRDLPFYVPLGVGEHLEAWGIPRDSIHEMKWWDEATLGDTLTLAATPSRHFSGRLPWTNNSTLWTSWAILGPTHRAWFSGDTGMTPQFEEIGERYGPFDVTMIEAGAYNKAWEDLHLGPRGALDAHAMVRGEVMMPIHWGTYPLALHDWFEPAQVTWTEGRQRDMKVVVPKVGGTFEPAHFTWGEPWW